MLSAVCSTESVEYDICRVSEIMRLPDKSSMYTAELSTIRMALELIRRLKQKSFVIHSDSLSSLQATQSCDIVNITVFDILKLCTQLSDKGKHVSL